MSNNNNKEEEESNRIRGRKPNVFPVITKEMFSFKRRTVSEWYGDEQSTRD